MLNIFFKTKTLNTSYTQWFIAKNASETNQLEIELDISCVADSNTLGKIVKICLVARLYNTI